MVTRDYYLTEVRITQCGFVYYLKLLPNQLLVQQRRTGFVAAWHRFPGQHFIFFSNWTSPNLVLFFKGMARCGH